MGKGDRVMNEIRCPKCKSTNWRCWDERTEWYKADDGELVEMLVGYMACDDCDTGFLSLENGFEHIGTYEDAFGHDTD